MKHRTPKREGLSRNQSAIWDAINLSTASIRQIAKKSGVSATMISAYLGGRYEPTASTLMAILETIESFDNEYELQMQRHEMRISQRSHALAPQ